ncbi:arginase family protein [Nonomuraea sp. NPDC049421]|uniref:arginase family protein n=1 Tax=Nonomuraea sp. NPDC049421 TaxID=3155275 RepID=UPI00341395E8
MNVVTVVEVPQWRGSGAPTAERLKKGARLLADMVGAGQRVRVAVEDDLVTTAARVRTALEEASEDFVVTTGGDCGVELEPVAAARRRYGDRLVVVWFDAHGDLNTPASSPSGAYHGMVLRALTGDGPVGLVAGDPLTPRQIVLAGVRDLDAAEESFIKTAGIRHAPRPDATALIEAIELCGTERPHEIPSGTAPPHEVPSGTAPPHEVPSETAPPHDADQPTPQRQATTARDTRTGTTASRRLTAGGGGSVVYVHIDFDVLDPEIFTSVGSPAPGGWRPEELLSLVRAVGERFDVMGLGLMEYEPARKEDQELLSSLVTDLVAACGHA